MTEREALEKVVAAWETLPAGHNRPRDVEQWMKDHMWHAVNDAREVLGRKRTDARADGQSAR